MWSEPLKLAAVISAVFVNQVLALVVLADVAYWGLNVDPKDVIE